MQLCKLGYEYATKAGISINVKDMVIPEEKKKLSMLLKLKLMELQKSITKVQLLMVRDIIRSSMFGHKQTKNFQKL